MLAFLAVQGFLSCVVGVAFSGCIAERTAALAAWRRAWARSVRGRRARRTLAYGALVVFVGTALALTLQVIAFGIAAFFPESSQVALVASTGLVTIFQFFYVTFGAAWCVVYYFDLRVRTEGLDLALRSDSLGRLRRVGALSPKASFKERLRKRSVGEQRPRRRIERVRKAL